MQKKPESLRLGKKTNKEVQVMASNSYFALAKIVTTPKMCC